MSIQSTSIKDLLSSYEVVYKSNCVKDLNEVNELYVADQHLEPSETLRNVNLMSSINKHKRVLALVECHYSLSEKEIFKERPWLELEMQKSGKKFSVIGWDSLKTSQIKKFHSLPFERIKLKQKFNALEKQKNDPKIRDKTIILFQLEDLVKELEKHQKKEKELLQLIEKTFPNRTKKQIEILNAVTALWLLPKFCEAINQSGLSKQFGGDLEVNPKYQYDVVIVEGGAAHFMEDSEKKGNPSFNLDTFRASLNQPGRKAAILFSKKLLLSRKHSFPLLEKV